MSTDEVLTRGLLEGFAKKGESFAVRSKITRAGFAFKASHLEAPNANGTYHDEWLDTRLGGGQELARVDDEEFTRLYAGGVIELDELKKLGITQEQVLAYLKSQITDLKGRTRLHQKCIPLPSSHWGYTYKIIGGCQGVGLEIAEERITYDNRVVFCHGFLLSPIK